MSTAITINEVGLRDGFQNQSQFVTTDDKLRMIDALLAAGVSHFEVTSFVNPKAVPQMADADELFRRLPSQSGVTYSALVGNLRGCERAVSAGVRSLAYVLSATDTMNRRNINLDLGGALESAKSVLKFGLSHRLEMRAYVATAFGCPFEGHVAPTVVERLAAELLDAGAGEIIVADTIGVADPMHVSRLLGSLVVRHGARSLSAHFHDTKGLALANCYAAFTQGIRKFDSSIGGLGGCPFAPGARGNAATEDLVNMFESGGYESGICLDSLVAAVEVAERCVSQTLGSRWLGWRRARQERSQVPWHSGGQA